MLEMLKLEMKAAEMKELKMKSDVDAEPEPDDFENMVFGGGGNNKPSAPPRAYAEKKAPPNVGKKTSKQIADEIIKAEKSSRLPADQAAELAETRQRAEKHAKKKPAEKKPAEKPAKKKPAKKKPAKKAEDEFYHATHKAPDGN